jgi:hypothetical protein
VTVPIESRWVSSLLGHRQLETALVCLGSLVRHSVEPLALRLHDDGTLTQEDRDRLDAELGAAALVSREEADDRATSLLARRPALRAYRRDHPLALKLIDAVLFAGEELAYCDSDILFLRPFCGLFRLHGPVGAVFMSDRQNAYSVRSWHLLAHRRLRLPRQVNSGVVVYGTAAYDPDLLEWYLSRPEFGFAPVWVEQTAWALLGWQCGCRLLDPLQVAFPADGEPVGEGVVALHFVSPVRSLLPRYAPLAAGAEGLLPAAVRSLPARRCRALDLAGTEARRWLSRL